MSTVRIARASSSATYATRRPSMRASASVELDPVRPIGLAADSNEQFCATGFGRRCMCVLRRRARATAARRDQEDRDERARLLHVLGFGRPSAGMLFPAS